MKILSTLLSSAAIAAALAITSQQPAYAQKYVPTATAGLSEGVQGGGSVGPVRARTTLRLGGEVSVDEFPKEIVAAAALIEMEPRTAVGADVRYLHLLTSLDAVHVGALAFFAPATLVGGTCGFAHRMSFGKKLAFSLGPTANVFVLGSDLPDRTIVWQAMLEGGIRADL